MCVVETRIMLQCCNVDRRVSLQPNPRSTQCASHQVYLRREALCKCKEYDNLLVMLAYRSHCVLSFIVILGTVLI